MKKRFSTDRQVAALKPLTGEKQTEYFHSTERGLILRVNPSSKKWVVKYNLNGQRKKYTLPTAYPNLSLSQAIKECRRIQGEAEKGIDPLGQKISRNQAPTVAMVMELYFKETPLMPKGLYESKRISDKDIIPAIGHIKASDLKRHHIKDIHRKITDRKAPVMANRVVELIRRAFNHAFEEELIEANTFPAIKKIKSTEYTRERVLSDEEIRLVWPALDTLSDNMRDIHKLLLLLGQRTQDICSMEIKDIDTEHKTWTVPAPPRGKNKQPNTLPLPPMAWAIVEPRLKGQDKWIFPSKYNMTRKGYTGSGHSISTKNARSKIISQTGVTDWTGHDLRRTLRTLLAREGVQPHIAERVVGHVQNGVEGIYDRYAYLDEKGHALLKLEKAIRKIVGMEQDPAKTLPLNLSK